MIFGRRWLITAVIAAALAGALWRLRDTSPMRRLATSVPADVRYVTARMSGGFPWAPLADKTRDGDALDARRIEWMAAIGRVVKKLSGAEGPEARHAMAVAYFLGGRTAGAIRRFDEVAEDERGANYWNDLAVVRYTQAVSSGSLDEMRDALTAVDHALRLEPRFAEALFNRALILQQFHFRDATIDAWKAFLAVDGESAWATEARQRLDVLTRMPPAFATEVERLYPRLERGDREAAQALLQIDAGEARYFMQNEGLARWGEAWLKGDREAAARRLTTVRTVATELAASSGEPILTDCVAAIDRARGAAAEALARGHVSFRDGRTAFRKKRNPTEAEKLLSAAQRDLAAGASPMAADAMLFTAVAVYGQNRFAEAEKMFRQLAGDASPRYGALRGYIDWQLASCVMARADWGEAIRYLQRAIATFETLREWSNRAYLHDILSQVYDTIGDRERAGRSRLIALQELGKTSSFRLEHAVAGMVSDATRRKDWRGALALLQVEVDVARRVLDKELQVNALLRRGLLASKLGHSADAEADLRSAAVVLVTVDDPALRTKLSFDRTTAAALIATEPGEAVELLTEALRFHEQKGWRMRLPDLYLRRGRMALALGDRRRAVADFEAGIAEIEAHRETLPVGEARWGVLNSADELFEEAIEAALEDGPASAFTYLERQRARSLSDTFARDTLFEPSKIPPGTVMLAYAVLPEKLIVFAIDRAGYHAREKGISREELTSLLGQFREAVRTNNTERRRELARTVYDLLVGPVEDRVLSRYEVIVMPDPAIATIPFVLLASGRTQRMLLEDHVVSTAPSARAYVHTSTRARGARRSALIVANPANDEMDPLQAAAAEADAIAASYPSAQQLTGRAATVRAFADRAPTADVIHFAGHGIVGGGTGALIMAPESGHSGRMDLAALSRLPLTRTSVVVVAACDSARAATPAGEDTVSVAYAFLQAGAPAVIATLWPISDASAAAFFPRLHRHLAKGVRAAEAVRLAQLESIAAGSGDRSDLWGAVLCIGD